MTPEDRYVLATSHVLERGAYRQALELLETLAPQEVRGIAAQDVWNLRGECLKQLDDLPGAVHAHQQAAESELETLKRYGRQSGPEGMSFFHLGRALLLQQEFARAEATARQGLEHFPQRWQLHDILAVALYRQGHTAEAIDVYRLAARRLEDFPPPLAARIASIYGSTLAALQYGAPACAVDEALPEEAPAGGGWVTAPVPELHSTLRNIERRHQLSPEEFIAEYARKNRPVLLSGLLEDWPAWQAWTRSAILQRYGDERVQVRKSSDVTDDNYQEGRQRPRMPLRDYITQVMGRGASGDRDPLYLFGLQLLDGVVRDHRPLPHFAGATFGLDEAQRQEKALFYIGPAWSGVSFHQHTAAWNALLFGYKRWFLLPPFHFYGPTTIAMHEWASTRRERFTPALHECVQRPGEVLFVPQYWHHAVLNTSDCVGLVMEVGPQLELLRHLLDAAAST
jgi:tetratricopeptide (TPR) repeat protein